MQSTASDLDLNWQKIERDMTKVGLSDGLSDGREQNFQRSFDKGYEDGFHNGFILGQLKFESEQKKKMDTLCLLDNAKTGMCVICTDEKENDDVTDVRAKQTHIVTLNVDKIKSDLEIPTATI